MEIRAKFLKLALGALAAMLLSITSTIAFGQAVQVNYNHSQSFAQFHTYAWQIEDPNKIANSILAQVAISDTDTALQGKGFSKVDISANPDLIVVATGGLRQQTSYSAWGMRGIGGGMGGITPEQNVEGTLIISIYDAKEKALIWRGIGQDTLSNNGNKNQQIVEKAIQKMFKQWPK
ncbi:MAG: DUF4136 domain-containing protein [Silvibacterium sp.]